MSIGTGNSPHEDRRGTRYAVPANLDVLLNQDQTLTLNKIENFGWRLAFVRQPLFETPIVVVTSPDRDRFGILEADGGINMHPDIVVRH